MKIVSIVGTRPNFMKIAPLINEFSKSGINIISVHTGQHYDTRMSHFFIDELGIKIRDDDHLVIQSSLSGDEQKAWLQETITGRLKVHKPDLVI